MADAIGRRIRDLQQRNDFLSQRLRHPGQRLGEQRRHLEHLIGRLLRAQNLSLDRRQLQLAALDSRVQRQHPHHAVKGHKDRLQRTAQRLHLGIAQRLQRAQQRYTQTTHLLDAVSPLKTVARGYAIVRDGQGAVVKSVTGVRSGDQLKAQIGDGEIVFAVTNTTALTLNGERQS